MHECATRLPSCLRAVLLLAFLCSNISESVFYHRDEPRFTWLERLTHLSIRLFLGFWDWKRRSGLVGRAVLCGFVRVRTHVIVDMSVCVYRLNTEGQNIGALTDYPAISPHLHLRSQLLLCHVQLLLCV